MLHLFRSLEVAVRHLLWRVVIAAASFDGGLAQAADHGTSPFGTLPQARSMQQPKTAAADSVPSAAGRLLTYRLLARDEAKIAGVPFELVDAVMSIESGYDPTRRGSVGEVGLMQVLPGTAAMLGYRGNEVGLAIPKVNIHYGTTYLGQAWQLAHGDVCRALMKYRAGHGEEMMTERSVTYCSRAKAHLAETGSPLAAQIAMAVDTPLPPQLGSVGKSPSVSKLSPQHQVPPGRRSPRLTGGRFWARFEARIKRLDAKVEARWRRNCLLNQRA